MTELVRISVELFGTARMVCGTRAVEIEAPPSTSAERLAALLAQSHPELRGKVVRHDGSGLLPSYTFNLNGFSFIDSGDVRLKPGDSVLLFSSQAGG